MAARRIRLFRGAALVAVLVGVLATRTAGVEPIVGTSVPGEPPAIELTDTAMGAISFDLDEDGVLELVVVAARVEAQGLSAIQAWWVAAGGTVEPSNQVGLRRSASVDEILAGRGRLGIDRDDMIAVGIAEPAKFLVVQRGNAPVLLVAAIGTELEAGIDVPCCLTIWEVTSAGRGEIDLTLVADTQRFAAELAAADLDADETDELMVSEGPMFGDTDERPDFGLLRWNGDQFIRTGFTIPSVVACCTQIQDVGDTDGRPGEEVLLVGIDVNSRMALHRVSLRSGAPWTERATFVPGDGGGDEDVDHDVAAAVAVDHGPGPAVVTGDGSTLFLWSWPSDGPARRTAFRTTGGVPIAVFGSGDNSRIMVSAGTPPGSVLVVPGDLGGGAGVTTTFGRDTRAGLFNGSFGAEPFSGPQPYWGIQPGEGGEPIAYVFAGTRIVPDDARETLAQAAPMALLAGLEPMGQVGEDGAWTALLGNFAQFGFGSPRIPPATDLINARVAGPLRLVSTASMLEPELGGGRLEPTFSGVAPNPTRARDLIVGNEAADAEIHAPPGTELEWASRGVASTVVVPLDGVARIRLLEPAGPDALDGSGATASIRLVTPAGHAYSGSWRISVYRQPPDLGIRADPDLIDFSPTLSGETLPGSELTINGVSVQVAADGSFTVPVEVGILPTELRVVVVDPVGNRTERVVTRVWPVDYRQLPFVPIAVLLTVAAGVILFLRRPDTGPTRRKPDDESTFEEIGG